MDVREQVRQIIAQQMGVEQVFDHETFAELGADVIDCGVPVLSMHAPYEVSSKFDIYSAYKTYKAFWNA